MKQLPRRTLLRGLGSALALPLLDAMAPATPKPPCRMAFLYVPNGIVMDRWTPQIAANTAPLPAELPSTTQAIAPYRQDVMLLAGLTHNGGRGPCGGPGGHRRGAGQHLHRRHSPKNQRQEPSNRASPGEDTAARKRRDRPLP